MIFIKITTLLVVFVLEYSLAATNSSSQITFTYKDGTTITYTSAQPQLLTSGIANICIQGAWVAYSGLEFKGGYSVKPPLKKRCYIYKNPEDYGSVRPIGNHGNIAAPAINFYAEEFYGGVDTLVTTEVPFVDFDIHSFVALNGASVEYFTGPNFTGTSICVEPPRGAECKGSCIYTVVALESIPIQVATQISNAKSIRVTDCSNRDNTVKIK